MTKRRIVELGDCAPDVGRAVTVCIKRPAKLGPQILTPEDVCALMKTIADKDRESMYAILLDSKHRVLGVEEIARGGAASVYVVPREVFKGAIAASASKVMVVHNHPSGDPTPSHEDEEVTRKFLAAGDLIGIPLLDHVVVADGGCISMAQRKPGLFRV